MKIWDSVYLCQNPLMGVWDNFFPTGTYTGIGTSVMSLKHVMKSTTKKKLLSSSQKINQIDAEKLFFF